MRANGRNFIRRLKKQKEDALEYAVEQYYPLVKGVVLKSLKLLNNPGLVEECINDVFLAVWQYVAQFEGEAEDFRKWIAVIAKYKATDAFRKAIKTKEIQMDEILVAMQESDYANLEKEEQFLDYLSSLNEVDRQIFVMKYYLSMKNEEIAEHLHLSKQAVENRLYRGKQKLKLKLTYIKVEGIQ